MALTVNNTYATYGVQRNDIIADRIITGVMDISFDSSYPTGGESINIKQYLNMDTIINVVIEPTDGYLFKYDRTNEKVLVYKMGGTMAAAGKTYTVTHDASPGGNQVYLSFESGVMPYLACNLANNAADTWVTLSTGIAILIRHDATPTGYGLTFDDDGTQPDRIIADLSGGPDVDVYVPTTHPNYFLKVKNATSGGVALYYDDATDERFECNTAGSADSPFDLAMLVDAAVEVPNATDLSSLTNVRMTIVGRLIR